jgi:catechol 2,3-dioxygenase-like lactoylglutathione lyase family enzyme
MISHLSLGTADLAASANFYDALFAPLGYVRLAGTKANELAYGPPGEGHFWLYAADGGERLASPGTHVAFRAASRDAVDAAAAAARGHRASFTREPGPHPDIAEDYYGAILLGPDGHKIEIVVE